MKSPNDKSTIAIGYVKIYLILIASLFVPVLAIAQPVLDGMPSSSGAYSLRLIKTSYSGYAIRVRRSSDNAEANVAFDGSSAVSAVSMVTVTPGITLLGGSGLGSSKTGTISSFATKTGTVTIQVSKTGTITSTLGSVAVTGVGTNFTTEMAAGDLLYNSANNAFIGIVNSISSNTSLTLNNYAMFGYTNIAFKNGTAAMTGTGTVFTSELAAGDRLFNSANTYLGTVISIASNTSLTLNARDAVTSSGITYKGTTASITGTGTLFTTELSVGDVLISNNITLGIISSIESATALTLATKAGASVSALAYKATAGTISFSSFYASASVYVKTWYDQSGNGRDITQNASTTNQARIVNAGTLFQQNGKTSMEFSNALGAYLQSSSAATWLNGSFYTMNKVSAEGVVNPSLQLPVSTTGGTGPANTIMHFGYRNSTQLTMAQYANDHNYNATPANSLEVHSAVKYSIASCRFYKNGLLLGTGTSGAGSYLSNVGLLSVGYYTGATTYYTGSVSEVVVFASALSATDVGVLNANQLAYYNIQTNNWTGNVDTDWANTANWSAALVPTAANTALINIPAGRPRYPVITGTASINSIVIETGATLTVTGTLQLSGTISSNSNCIATAGTVEYTGAAPQAIAANTYSTGVVKNVTIHTPNITVSMSTGLTISGTLTFTSGKLFISSYALTLGGNVVNTVAGCLTGSTSATLNVNSTASPSLSFDQTTSGATNVVNNLVINSPGQTVSLSNTLNISNAITVTAGTFDLGTNTANRSVAGGTLTVSNGARLKIGGVNQIPTNFSTHVIGATSTIEYAGSDQLVNALNSSQNYGHLTVSGSGTKTLAASITVAGTTTIAAGTLADAGYQFTSTGTLIFTGGIFRLGTASTATSWPAFSTNTISNGATVEYIATLAQTVSGVPTYSNLTLSGAGGKTAGGNIMVNGTFNNSTVLNMTAAYTLGGTLSTITNTGTIKTGVSTTTSAVPIASGKTWGGTIEYTGSTGPQTAVTGTFNNLTISGTSGAVAANDITVNGILTLASVNPSSTAGLLETTGSYVLYMGPTATTVSSDGDVTGTIKRTSISANTFYSFGSQFTTISVTPGILPTAIAVTVTIGAAPSGKPDAVARYYEMNYTGGSGSFINQNFHYLDAELNGNTESNLVTGDYDIGGGSSTPDEHGRSDYNYDNNYVGMAGIPMSYFHTSWRTIFLLANFNDGAYLKWNGSRSSIWTNSLNWTPTGVPGPGSRVIIPDGADTDYDPALITTEIKSISIENNAVFALGSAILTINGGSGAWNDAGGILDHGTGKVIFTGKGATISGIADFYDIEIGDTADITNQLGSTMKVSGTVTRAGGGKWYADLFDATVQYDGADQTVLLTDALPVYHNLILSGSGIKTLPASYLDIHGSLTLSGTVSINAAAPINVEGTLAIAAGTSFTAGNYSDTLGGDFINNGTFTATGNTFVLNGSAEQFIDGSATVSFNNLTVNNTMGVSISKDISISNNLVFNAGFISTGSNTLTLSGSIINNTSGGIRGNTNGNLILNGTAARHLSFDQGVSGSTNVLHNLTINSSTVTTVDNDLLINGTITFGSGKLAIGDNVTLTAKDIAGNTAEKSFVGSSAGNMLLDGTSSFTIYFDQSVTGSTNALNNFNINSSGEVVSMGNDLEINNCIFTAGKLAINGNTLTLQGLVTNTADGGIRAGSTSNIIINGTESINLSFDQTVPDSTNTIKDVTINCDGQTVTLSNALRLTGTHIPAAGVLQTGGNYTIASSASGTASIAAGNSSGGYITGNVSVERYIPQNANRAWRLLTSPTSGQTIKEAWQENQPAGVNGSPGYGTIITSNIASWAEDGFDFKSPKPSMYSYDQSLDSLLPVTSTNVSIANEQGYFLYIRGSRSVMPSSSITTINPAVLRTYGTLYTGDQSSVHISADKFGLVGNPYASALDLRNVSVSGGCTGTSFYVWDPKLTGSYGLGAYQTLTPSGANYIVTPGGGSYGSSGTVTNTIQSGAAFFVQATGSTGTVTINESSKTTGSSMVFRPGSGINDKNLITGLFVINGSAKTLADGNMVLFNESYDDTVGGMDSRKMINFGENISLIKNNSELVVERRKLPSGNDTIQFNMYGLKKTTYLLQILSDRLQQSNMLMFLEDEYLNTLTVVNTDDTTYYPFIVDTNAGSFAVNRFRIVFKSAGILPVTFTTVTAGQQASKIAVKWRVDNQLNIRDYQVERSLNGIDFTKVAVVPVSSNASFTYYWLDENPVPGTNYYRIKSIGTDEKTAYSKVVKVLFREDIPALIVSPNPVTGNIMNLQFTGQVRGNYKIRLINNAGQSVFSKTITYEGGNGIQTVNLPAKIINGTYQLEVIAPGDSRKIQQVFITGNK